MSSSLDHLVARAESLLDRLEGMVPGSIHQPDWNQSIAFRYRKRSWGVGALVPVVSLSLVSFEALKEIEPQKIRIRNNTAQFVQGLPANNVLLTGARGTGKSSLVKACLHAFHGDGLRLIEVEKTDMADLRELIEVLSWHVHSRLG